MEILRVNIRTHVNFIKIKIIPTNNGYSHLDLAIYLYMSIEIEMWVNIRPSPHQPCYWSCVTAHLYYLYTKESVYGVRQPA